MKRNVPQSGLLPELSIIDINCPSCRRQLRLYPKCPGPFEQGWMMNCTICSNKNLALDPYDKTHLNIISELNKLIEQYQKEETREEVISQIELLAEQYDQYLYHYVCECGGNLSIAAYPKCPYCDIEITGYTFHYVDEKA